MDNSPVIPVIVVMPTSTSGVMIRWFRDVAAAERHNAMMSASRHGVAIHAAFLTDIPDSWVASARRAHAALRAGDQVVAEGMATHRHRRFLNGPLEAIQDEGE